MPEICVSLAVGWQGLDIVLLGHDLKNKHQDTRVQRKIKLGIGSRKESCLKFLSTF